MPELTVSMPAYNSGKFIRKAIESVLCQKDVDFELIVVDDASQDDTVEIVNSFQDNRIKLIRNQNNKGIGYCHNVAIDQSNSPFIIHVDSDDIILPGAFKKMIDKIKCDPNIGQVHCYHFNIEEDGNVTREAFQDMRRSILANKRPGMDYRRALLIHGSMANPLRTYRKEVFNVVGKFKENLKYSEDYEMALRIIDKYDICLVPEFLYAHRKHKNSSTGNIKFEGLVFWCHRFLLAKQLEKSHKIHFVKGKKYNINRLMILGLIYNLRLDVLFDFFKKFKTLPWKFRQFNRVLLLPKIYTLIIPHLGWWPIGFFKTKRKDHVNSEKRIAYYEWRFPTLSETFIHRELIALKESGNSVVVFADIPGDLQLVDGDIDTLVKQAQYLKPIDENLMSEYKKYFFSKHPLRYLNLLVYVICHQYGAYKNLQEDKFVFGRALYLAGMLRRKKINHIHTPWADQCAFAALIASRLLGIPFTVQARAHDIHRKRHLYSIREKFENATFIITNTKYNHSHIKSMLKNQSSLRLYTIYEGLDLDKFKPNSLKKNISKNVKILSVARLIEEKGLTYLLKTCKILKEKGLTFQCNIIGEAEEPLYTYYYLALKKLHRELNLEDCVFFLGAQPFKQVLEAYKKHDIFILPCVIARNGGRDISPNSLLEAMAMKMPVISTTIAAIPEIVDDGENGLLVPPNNENALADAAIKLIQDYNSRKTLGENARKKIEKRFDIHKNLQQYFALLNGNNLIKENVY